MSLNEVTGWIEAHPYEAAAIGGGGLLVILWWLGFFSGGGSSADSGGGNAAGAWYAAEAAQAQVGGQVQMASISATRDTAIAGLVSSAQEAIAATNAGAAVTINGQNTGALVHESDNSLLATYSNNDATVAGLKLTTDAAVAVNASNNSTSILQTIYGKLIPYELKLTHGTRAAVTLPGSLGGGAIRAGQHVAQPLTPKAAKAAGYTRQQYAALTHLPLETAAQWQRRP